MAEDSFLRSVIAFQARFSRLIAELHAQAEGARWELSLESLAEVLRRSAAKHFATGQANSSEVEAYLKSLHLQDLALACACSEGNERAWEFFIAHYRQDLRTAASAMLRGSGLADDARSAELADSLYAELYGIRSGKDGRRKSLFDYFHGRSKLSTWLRAVLAQKQVDLIRASGRTVSLDNEMDNELPRELGPRTNAMPADPEREVYLRRFDRALTVALAELTPRERMILACYYLDQLTLAEIGCMLREHESTVSRQLERIRQALRENVTGALQQASPACNGRPGEPALDAAQVELVFEYALQDWPFDLSRALTGEKSGGDAPEN
jgi:RNA polymerase sigma-70 factor, ECF subfamily